MAETFKPGLAFAFQKPEGENMGALTEGVLKAGGLKYRFKYREDDARTNIAGLDVWKMRNGDIASSVARGWAILGVVGLDQYKEYSNGKPAPLIINELGFSPCTVKLGLRNDLPFENPQSLNGLTIITSLPNLTREYLMQNDVDAEVISRGGGSETVTKRLFTDASVEVSDTGTSFDVNNMRPVATLLESQSVLIAYPGIAEDYKGSEAIVWRALRTVMTGLWSNYYQIMKFDFPTANAAEIMKDMPARESPTQMPLRKRGWAAAETLVPTRQIQEVIERIMPLGAKAIIHKPIEGRLLPEYDDRDINRMMRAIYGEDWVLPNPPYALY